MDDLMVSNLEQALSLARQGLAIFPCHSGGDKVKSPMPFIKWREASTCDEGQIRHWWQKWPEAAIGLDLAKSGLLVIDCDRHSEEENGVAAFGKLAYRHNFNMDSAPLVATPNRGTHVFFKQSPKAIIGNGRGNLPSGIDVRGNGGYVIAPGTIMQDGRDYELFGDIALAPVLPDWLLDILKSPKDVIEEEKPHSQPMRQQNNSNDRIARYCDAAIADEVTRVENAKKGERNNTLNQSAFALGQLVGAGWVSETEISALLLNAATQNGVPVSEAQKTIRSGIKAGIKEPRQELDDDFVDFDPVEAKLVADMIMAAHEKHEREKNGAKLVIMGDDGIAYDADTGEIIEEEEQEEAVADEFHLEYPEGLVGDIARWITETGRYQQPELAIGAAIALVGTIAGRQFCGPTRSGTHLYILGLAPTGKGKDHSLQQIARIMSAASLSHHLGPSEFISMPSVINFLQRKPLSICPMDEFGDFMKRINSKRASGFEGAISKVLRTMWGSSFATYLTPEWAQKASETIFSPSLTIFGMSTPEQFYSSMESASLNDGTLNRFLLLNGRSKVSQRDPHMDALIVPKNIVDGLRRIYFKSGEMIASTRNDPTIDPTKNNSLVIMKWCPDGAQNCYEEFSQEIEHLVEKEAESAPFYARTVEMALRIATIIAAGRLDDNQVHKSDMDYGISIAYHSAKFMKNGATDYMADNENQANAQKIIRAIKSRGGRVSHSVLLRSLQNSIRTRDLKELLQSLCEAEIIERIEIKPPKGRPSIQYHINK